ncbi:hypothetical protein QU24_18595 [Pantoea rodasii]|uniref:Uncharacterized protein n=1 Tax=Pantoea rodasii TaxID=1076549 RepID=A0A0B1R4L6_9GAMM|nr:hypothetical protein [Pantoea rodasii]KHJ66601.1 hypothetical protein QU24_18595 [Pantoea rodasii]
MASVDDVSKYLAKRVADVLYPGGTDVTAIIDAPVKIYPGWPVPGPLQQDIDVGGVHVSVWSLPSERRVNPPLGRPFRTLPLSEDNTGIAVRELRRQIKDFQVTVWAPSPQLRNTIGTAIDAALSEHCHIDLGDGAPAQMFYTRQFDSDSAENWHVYRRDLIFSVNFATTQTIRAPEVTNITVNLNGHNLSP